MENTKKTQKNAIKYECLICHFNTSNKTDYSRHLDTEKHKNRVIISNNNNLTEKNVKFSCECGKMYKHKPNLYTHKKKCDYKNNQTISTQEENINYKEIINELMNQNKIFQNTIIEQNKKIIELAEKPTNINNITTNNTNNTTNQNLNINLFLNEKCKDAISIDDFVKQIIVSINDLLFIKDKGIIKGIANIISNKLKELPLDKRPIWCSDKKRKKIFIKDKEWAEDVDNIKTKQAICDVTAIQTKNISSKYKNEYPNYMDNEDETEKYMIYVKQNTETTKGKEEAIITNLIDTIYLDDKSKNILQ
jgi:hypothetical protein